MIKLFLALFSFFASYIVWYLFAGEVPDSAIYGMITGSVLMAYFMD